MTPLDPAELSAYLDGELPAARRKEIETLLAEDPALRAEYEALRCADALWRQAGAGAAFFPVVELRRTGSNGALWAAALAPLLLAARVLDRLVETLGPAMLLNLAALALVLALVLVLARRDLHQA